MNLLKAVNQQTNKMMEDAAGGAVGAGGVAGFAMPLFSTLVSRSTPPVKVLSWGNKKKKSKRKDSLGLSEAYHTLAEDFQDGTGIDSTPNTPQTTFDTSEVMAKLKGLENKDKQDHRDTVTFGLEDDNGELIRVSIRHEQAEDFERALQAIMAEKENDDELPEIAELLFKLKDRFDIVDIEWPEVEEDQEEATALAPGEQEGGAPGEEGGLDIEGGAPGEEAMPPEAGQETGQVTDLLTQVIDMMKADAEARKAEAKAKEAEAKTKEANAVVQQTMTKVKQEEQFLDMDQYNKSKKEEEREAKRLAQLAKWKRDMERDEGVTDEFDEKDFANIAPKQGGREEEETVSYSMKPSSIKPQQPHKGSTIRGRVNPYDIASFILSRVK